jgi:hypothetical protein
VSAACQPIRKEAAESAPDTDFDEAGTVYAGTQPRNYTNPKSVSQYDVAGFQQSH